MSKAALYSLSFLLAAILFASGFFFGRRSAPAPVSRANITDTLKFYLDPINKSIASLNDQLKSLQLDTQRINNKYDLLLQRIYSSKGDSAQLAILKELLNKPNPTPIDINEELVKGARCCEILDNSRLQFKACDSARYLLDSSNTILVHDDSLLRVNITEKDIFVTQLNEKLQAQKKKKVRWVKIAIVEGAIITGRIALKVFLNI